MTAQDLEQPVGDAFASASEKVLVSHTGIPLTRSTAYRFTLDVTPEQHHVLMSHAGAARWAYNHHLGRVKENLEQRQVERERGVAEKDLTKSLSWSKVSFINEVAAYKNGTAPDSPVNEDGSRGLAWRHEVTAVVFETASVNAAQALKNWGDSKYGSRKGKPVGFPKFKSKYKSTPTFRVRSKSKPGQTSPLRPAGPRKLQVPGFGELPVREHTGQLAAMLAKGRFHCYAATLKFVHGRWIVTVTGVAAQFHHLRRNPKASGRHQPRVGTDLGIKSPAVVANEHGVLLRDIGKEERHAQYVAEMTKAEHRLKLANQAFSRTKKGSRGRDRARNRLQKAHARIAHLRENFIQVLTTALVTGCSALVIEDLNAAGMLKNRCLARAVANASFGKMAWQFRYKSEWYGTELTVAERWFASTKTCSGCGALKAMPLSLRIYECPACGLSIDRDLNAAINLARWQPAEATVPGPRTPPDLPVPSAAA